MGKVTRVKVGIWIEHYPIIHDGGRTTGQWIEIDNFWTEEQALIVANDIKEKHPTLKISIITEEFERKVIKEL